MRFRTKFALLMLWMVLSLPVCTLMFGMGGAADSTVWRPDAAADLNTYMYYYNTTDDWKFASQSPTVTSGIGSITLGTSGSENQNTMALARLRLVFPVLELNTTTLYANSVKQLTIGLNGTTGFSLATGDTETYSMYAHYIGVDYLIKSGVIAVDALQNGNITVSFTWSEVYNLATTYPGAYFIVYIEESDASFITKGNVITVDVDFLNQTDTNFTQMQLLTFGGLAGVNFLLAFLIYVKENSYENWEPGKKHYRKSGKKGSYSRRWH